MFALKFKISPWFFVMMFLFALTNNGLSFFVYFFTVICHELCHSITAGKLGYELNEIELMPYGAKISMQNNFACIKDEILIAIAGPIFNVSICILCLCLWCVCPSLFIYTQLLFMSNLSTFLFNCIPVFPLDGGRVLSAILSKKISFKNKTKILKILNIVFFIIILIAFIISVFMNINYNFLVVAIFLFTNLFSKSNDIYYDFAFKKTNDNNLKNKVKIESFLISQNATLFDCFKLMNKNKEMHFAILNEKYEIVKNLASYQIEQLLLTHNTHTKLCNFV